MCARNARRLLERCRRLFCSVSHLNAYSTVALAFSFPAVTYGCFPALSQVPWSQICLKETIKVQTALSTATIPATLCEFLDPKGTNRTLSKLKQGSPSPSRAHRGTMGEMQMSEIVGIMKMLNRRNGSRIAHGACKTVERPFGPLLYIEMARRGLDEML